MLAEGMGLTLMPELADPKKQTKKDAKPSRRIGLLYRKGSYREEAFRNIQGLIRELVTDK